MQVIYTGSTPRTSQERSRKPERGGEDDKQPHFQLSPAEGSFSLILWGSLECSYVSGCRNPDKGAGLPYSLDLVSQHHLGRSGQLPGGATVFP